jgi:outer membrane protein assembly factor BamB
MRVSRGHLTLLASLLLPACDPPPDPSGLGGDSTTPRADWSVGRGQVVWANYGANGRGVVSQTDSLVFFPGRNRTLYALRKSTGQLLWKATTNPAAGGTRGLGSAATAAVVVMADAELYAFDVNTGARKWVFAGDGQRPGNSNPVADPDGSRFYSGSWGGMVWAINAETGSAVWSAPSPDGDSLAAFDPVVADSVVYVGYATMNNVYRGGLAAYHTRTGQRLWYHDFKQYVSGFEDPRSFGNVAVAGNLVFATVAHGFVLAIDRDTGALRWKVGRFPDTFGTGPDLRGVAFADGKVITAGILAVFTALDAATGRTLWTVQANAGSYNSLTANGPDVFGDFAGGTLVVLNTRSKAITWRQGPTPAASTRPPLFGAPAVDSRAVYAGSSDGPVFAFKR